MCGGFCCALAQVIVPDRKKKNPFFLTPAKPVRAKIISCTYEVCYEDPDGTLVIQEVSREDIRGVVLPEPEPDAAISSG